MALPGSPEDNQFIASETDRIQSADQAVRDKWRAKGIELPPVFVYRNSVNLGRFNHVPSSDEIAARKELQQVYNVPKDFEGSIFDFNTGKEKNFVNMIPEYKRKEAIKFGQFIPYTKEKYTGQDFYSPYSEPLSSKSYNPSEKYPTGGGSTTPTIPKELTTTFVDKTTPAGSTITTVPTIPNKNQIGLGNDLFDASNIPAGTTATSVTPKTAYDNMDEAVLWAKDLAGPFIAEDPSKIVPVDYTKGSKTPSIGITAPNNSVNDAITAVKNATAGNNSLINQNVGGFPTIPKGITMGGGIGGVSNQSADVWDYLKNFQMPNNFEPPNTDAPKVGWGI